jgi:hypothetical protein
MLRPTHVPTTVDGGCLLRAACAVISLTAIAAWPGRALATPIDIGIPYGSYGHESNIAGRCAATSMINSFVYLDNIAPALYGNGFANSPLLKGPNVDKNGDGVVNLQDSIISLDDVMGGNGCGVNRQQAWQGKLSWFNMFAPSTTTFAGMVDEDFTGWIGSQYLTRGVPTINFLLGELQHREDVELRIGFADGSGHYVTLSSLHIDDTNNNGTWDPTLGETASLDYIDPNCPNGTNAGNPGPSVVPIMLIGGTIHFGWRNGNGTTCDPGSPTEDVSITAAWAESPVPEPASLLLLGSGLAAIARLRRRKRRT